MNQNLSKLLAQLRGIWSQLGPSQKGERARGDVCAYRRACRAFLLVVAGRLRTALWRRCFQIVNRPKSSRRSTTPRFPIKPVAARFSVASDKIYTLRMQLAGRLVFPVAMA